MPKLTWFGVVIATGLSWCLPTVRLGGCSFVCPAFRGSVWQLDLRATCHERLMATRARSWSAIGRPIHTELEYIILLYKLSFWRQLCHKKSMLKKWNSLYVLSVKLNLLMWFSISELCDNWYTPPLTFPQRYPWVKTRDCQESISFNHELWSFRSLCLVV